MQGDIPMAVKQILMIGDETLKGKSEAVDFSKDPVDLYIRDLMDTLHHFQKKKGLGRAIAGPQIGLMKKMICMDSSGERIVMINPEIIRKSSETFKVWDSCFSADAAFFGMTLRHREITVEYYDETTKRCYRTFSGDLSELFQHEIDHLQGVLFTDRIIDNRIIMRSEWEKIMTRREVNYESKNQKN